MSDAFGAFQRVISTHFARVPAPARIVTACRRQPKRSARSATSSALAAPSTGGDLSHATQLPSGSSDSSLLPERGFTHTLSLIAVDCRKCWHRRANVRRRGCRKSRCDNAMRHTAEKEREHAPACTRRRGCMYLVHGCRTALRSHEARCMHAHSPARAFGQTVASTRHVGISFFLAARRACSEQQAASRCGTRFASSKAS